MLATHTHTHHRRGNTTLNVMNSYCRMCVCGVVCKPRTREINICKPSPNSYIDDVDDTTQSHTHDAAHLAAGALRSGAGYTNLIIHYKLDEKFLIKVYIVWFHFIYVYAGTF